MKRRMKAAKRWVTVFWKAAIGDTWGPYKTQMKSAVNYDEISYYQVPFCTLISCVFLCFTMVHHDVLLPTSDVFENLKYWSLHPARLDRIIHNGVVGQLVCHTAFANAHECSRSHLGISEENLR